MDRPVPRNDTAMCHERTRRDILPPLAEQRRIVAKVDELMVLCERLEATLLSGEDHRSRNEYHSPLHLLKE